MTPPFRSRRRPHPAWLVGGLVLAAIAAVAAAIVIWPALFGLQRTFPFTQLVSFRVVALCALAVIVLALAVTLFASPTVRRFLGPSTAVLAVAALALGSIVLVRGVSLGSGPTDADGAIRVLSWNTLGNEPGSPTIAQLALDYRADVVALPETTESMGEEIAGLMREGGRPMWVFSATGADGYRAAETTLLISDSLGKYDLTTDFGSTGVLASVVATPESGDGPTFVATHPVAPVPAFMSNWRSDLEWVASICSGDAIVAGDFNATLDHFVGLESADAPGSVIGACHDAALEAGSASMGTWTSGKPPILVPAIDHVLYSGAWQVNAFEVITSEDRAGSDHRPIFAELVRNDAAR